MAVAEGARELVREIERVCQPRFLTEPPVPFSVLSNLSERLMRPTYSGDGYRVYLGDSSARVDPRGTTLTLRRTQKEPAGARLWTREELTRNARAVADLIRPTNLILGKSTVGGNTAPQISTELVHPTEPGVVIADVSLRMDEATGLPTYVDKRKVWSEVDPSTLRGVLLENQLLAEALRIHRSLPTEETDRLTTVRSRIMYIAPDFQTLLNEMTADHRRQAELGKRVPIYMWWGIAAFEGHPHIRTIYVDARTGRGIAMGTRALQMALPEAPLDASRPNVGRWRLDSAEGSFQKVGHHQFEGVPIVMANDKGEVLTLRFDVKSGLIEDESWTYRLDSALLKVLREQKPVRPFGKK